MLFWLLDIVCPENDLNTVILKIKLLFKTIAQTEAKTEISITNIHFFLLTTKIILISPRRLSLHFIVSLADWSTHNRNPVNVI